MRLRLLICCVVVAEQIYTGCSKPWQEMCIGGDGPINNRKHSQRCAYKFHLFMQPGFGAHVKQKQKPRCLSSATCYLLQLWHSGAALFRVCFRFKWHWCSSLFIKLQFKTSVLCLDVDFSVLYLYLFLNFTVFSSSGRDAPVAVACHRWINRGNTCMWCLQTAQKEREWQRGRKSTIDILKKESGSFQDELFP